MSATIEFNRKCIPASEYVVVRIFSRNESMKLGNILLPDSYRDNDRLAFCQVLEVGKKAHEEYGLEKNDYVCIDRLATAYQTAPIAVTKYVNVICKSNEDNTKFSPLKNMVFVRDEVDKTQNIGGLLITNYDKKLNIGEVVAMNVEDTNDVPYKVGDKVMLSKGGDSLTLGTEHVIIYKKDMIVCKVIEEESAI